MISLKLSRRCRTPRALLPRNEVKVRGETCTPLLGGSVARTLTHTSLIATALQGVLPRKATPLNSKANALMSFRTSLLLIFLLFFLSVGQAQRLVLIARGSPTFNPSIQEYTDALLCNLCNYLAPTRFNDKITLRLENKNAQAATVQVRRAAYTPFAELELEARYVLTNATGTVVGIQEWLPLSQLPETLYSGRDKDIDFAIDYRLRVTGLERAGSYETSVTYNVGTDSVSHKLRFTIPSASVLRVTGQTSSVVTVTFDYLTVNAVAYVRAVEKNTLLPFTSSALKQVELLCTNSSGCAVNVQLFDMSTLPSTNVLNRVYLFGKVANGQRLQRTTATNGFEIIVRPEDLTLFVDGKEDPGEFRFAMQYQLTVNR
jgi:hypothetical protein